MNTKRTTLASALARPIQPLDDGTFVAVIPRSADISQFEGWADREKIEKVKFILNKPISVG